MDGLDQESLLLHLLRAGIASRAAAQACCALVRGAGVSYAAAKGFIGSHACGKGQGGSGLCSNSVLPVTSILLAPSSKHSHGSWPVWFIVFFLEEKFLLLPFLSHWS